MYSVIIVLGALLMAAPASAGQSPDSQAAKPAQTDGPKATSSGASPATAPEANTKPNKKIPKVYTDDDFKGRGIFSSGGEQLDFDELNDCDRDCFNRVRQGAHVYSADDQYWRRDVLAALDAVRKDAQWQTLLADLYAAHLKFCRIASDKQSELAKVADPNNVTPREIAVDEKYDAQFRSLQTSVQSLYQRLSAIQSKYAANSYSRVFMNIQSSRIQNAGCPATQQPESPSTDSNDP